jgi:hypothetical protein
VATANFEERNDRTKTMKQQLEKNAKKSSGAGT